MGVYKNILLEIVQDRPIIDENKPLTYRLRLENFVNSLSEVRAKKLVKNILREKPELDPSTKTAISIGGVGLNVAKVVGSGGMGVPVLYLLYRAIRGAYDECSKSCGVYAINTPKRQICMSRCRYIRAKSILDGVRKHKSPAHVIKNAESKYAQAKENYERYKSYAIQKGLNPTPNVVPGRKTRFAIPK